ncbi:MAG: hypothetical protein AAF517_17125, partial [Planctomycetota bacterium]
MAVCLVPCSRASADDPETDDRAPLAGLFEVDEPLRTSLSFQGLPGLFDTPTAATVPDGSVDFSFNTK